MPKIQLSLRVKLTLAFLLVGITGAMLTAALLRYQVNTAFDEFLLSREQQSLVEALLSYYRRRDSWDGLALEMLPPAVRNPAAPQAVPEARRPIPFTLLDRERRIVFSTQGRQMGRQVQEVELNRAVPLLLQNQPIGWLLFDSAALRSPLLRQPTPEFAFLQGINRAALLSALAAAGLALLVGGLLALSITRTLRELTAAALAIAAGRLGVHAPVRSSDELGQLASAFNQMSDDLGRANQARRQMTADIAHDLRSPLSVLSGYAEALSDGKLPGTPEIYTILHQETLHLNRLVDDLRTLSLADAGELPLAKTSLPAVLLLERAAARYALAAQEKQISLSVDAAPDLPNVTVDPERLAQVLDNLVGNALRYTPPGGSISLHAAVDGAWLTLAVQDSGAGIAPADLPFVFDRFYRADKSRTSGDASGLGLAIARAIVRLHGGDIHVTSTPGAGSRFTVRILL